MRKILVISAHADDETLGMGGTLLRLSADKNTELHWLIVTKIWKPKWSVSDIDNREDSINSICKKIDFVTITRWDYKDNKLDTYPVNDIQEDMIKLFDLIEPNTIFTPSVWDFNHDHRLVCSIVEMSAKSYYSKYIEEIISYEIPSANDQAFKTVHSFTPNVYYDISANIDGKLDLLKCYDSELGKSPHPRSIEYIESLAKVRGSESGFEYAEAFHLFKSCR